MSHPSNAPKPSDTRTGLTIVEVLVALMLLMVGMLALAGSSALSFRTATSAQRERAAVQRAISRIAILSAEGCVGPSAGTSGPSPEGMRERWVRSRDRAGIVTLDARVDWQGGGSSRAVALQSALTC